MRQSSALGPRERRVLELTRLGFSDKEIARELQMAQPTVRVHILRLKEKFGARNRCQLGEIAAKLELSDEDRDYVHPDYTSH